MPTHYLRHDLDEDPTVHDEQVLGEHSPLEFEDGEAIVADEQTATDLVRRHSHLLHGGRVDGDEEADEEAEAAEDEADPADLPDLSGEEWRAMASAYDFEDVNGRNGADDIKAAFADLSDDEQADALATLD